MSKFTILALLLANSLILGYGRNLKGLENPAAAEPVLYFADSYVPPAPPIFLRDREFIPESRNLDITDLEATIAPVAEGLKEHAEAQEELISEAESSSTTTSPTWIKHSTEWDKEAPGETYEEDAEDRRLIGKGGIYALPTHKTYGPVYHSKSAHYYPQPSKYAPSQYVHAASLASKNAPSQWVHAQSLNSKYAPSQWVHAQSLNPKYASSEWVHAQSLNSKYAPSQWVHAQSLGSKYAPTQYFRAQSAQLPLVQQPSKTGQYNTPQNYAPAAHYVPGPSAYYPVGAYSGPHVNVTGVDHCANETTKSPDCDKATENENTTESPEGSTNAEDQSSTSAEDNENTESENGTNGESTEAPAGETATGGEDGAASTEQPSAPEYDPEHVQQNPTRLAGQVYPPQYAPHTLELLTNYKPSKYVPPHLVEAPLPNVSKKSLPHIVQTWKPVFLGKGQKQLKTEHVYYKPSKKY